MSLIPKEKILLESNEGWFQLTSHKVRLNSIYNGSGNVVSIMLEHITSCEVAKRSNPIWLVLATLTFLAGGFITAKIEKESPAIIGIVTSVIFIVIYFATRSQFLSVLSPSSQINLDTKDLALEKILEVIDEIEAAKDKRMTAFK